MDTFDATRLLIVAPNTRFVRLFLARQIDSLAGLGFSVQLICALDVDGQDSLHDLRCTVTFVDIAREISLRRDLLALLRLLTIIWNGRPSVVHTHGPKPSLLGALASLLCGVRTRLHTIHGLRSDGLHGTRRVIVRMMERLTFACSSRCFAVSRSLADHVVSEGLIVSRKTAVLGHGSWAGIDVKRFAKEPHVFAGAAFRASHAIARDAVVVTYVGRLAHDKGLQTLVEAWRTVSTLQPRARLIVAGPPDDTDPLSDETMMRLRSERSVLLIETFVQDVPRLLAASDIFVQPSLREGLGVAALEAAAMQLPVVAASVTGLVDTVEDSSSGFLVPSQDAEALAKALHFLVVHPSTRRSFGLSGQRLVNQRFAQEDVLKHSLKMYCALRIPLPGRLNTAGKRAFDLVASLLLLAIASPLMIVVAAAIWICLSCPVLFRQERAGLHGRPIQIFKFRTMKQPEPGQPMIGTDELRTHWLGLFLRKFSLDELPQLFNVVRGEMSLVGPRPLLLSYWPRYSDRQRHRHDTSPGITGWAQVNGRNTIAWEQRFELDLWYVEHRSAKLDLTILFLTLRRVLWPHGVTPDGQTSMPEFLGASNRTQS